MIAIAMMIAMRNVELRAGRRDIGGRGGGPLIAGACISLGNVNTDVQAGVRKAADCATVGHFR